MRPMRIIGQNWTPGVATLWRDGPVIRTDFMDIGRCGPQEPGRITERALLFLRFIIGICLIFLCVIRHVEFDILRGKLAISQNIFGDNTGIKSLGHRGCPFLFNITPIYKHPRGPVLIHE